MDTFNAAGSKGYAQEMLGRSSCSKVAACAPRGEMYHILHGLYILHHYCHAYHKLWEQTCGEGVNSPVETGLKDLCVRHVQTAKLFAFLKPQLCDSMCWKQTELSWLHSCQSRSCKSFFQFYVLNQLSACSSFSLRPVFLPVVLYFTSTII